LLCHLVNSMKVRRFLDSVVGILNQSSVNGLKCELLDTLADSYRKFGQARKTSDSALQASSCDLIETRLIPVKFRRFCRP